MLKTYPYMPRNQDDFYTLCETSLLLDGALLGVCV